MKKKKKKQVDVLIYAPNNFVPNVLMELLLKILDPASLLPNMRKCYAVGSC